MGRVFSLSNKTYSVLEGLDTPRTDNLGSTVLQAQEAGKKSRVTHIDSGACYSTEQLLSDAPQGTGYVSKEAGIRRTYTNAWRR